MKLEFDSILLSDFKSFIGAPHELVLSSFGPGLHFVRGNNLDEPRLGQNGAGKSTLFDAICWCLFGRTCTGLRNPDIKARFGSRGARVVLTIRIDGTAHKVARTANPNKLVLDDREVGQDDIEALICLNFDTFINTILYGQGRPLFYDLEPAKKLALFGTALNLDRWETRSSAAGDATDKLEEQESGLVRKLATLDAQLEQTDRLLTQALGKWKTWRDEQEELAEAAKKRVEALVTQKDAKETERGSFDLAYDSAETEISALRKEIAGQVITGEDLIFKRSGLNAQLGTFRAQISELEKELEALGTADTCPVCKQSIKGTDLAEHKRESERKLKELTGKRTRLSTSVEALTDQNNDNQRKLSFSRARLEEFQHKANTARDRRDQITPEVARLDAEIKQLREGLKQQERAANPYTEQTQQLRKDARELEATKKQKGDQLPALRAQIERTKFWVRGFKEVRLYELEDVLQELEITTASTLESVGLIDWRVQYVVEKETKSGTIQRGLSVFIQGPHDKAPVRWECWSGGEGQRLRLVGALALSEVLLSRAGVEPNFEVLDEPTQHLSSGGIEDLCELLAERAQLLGRMVFYCDHQSVESVRFSSVLTIIKDQEGSRLELEG